jgi:tRNA(Ile2) C34 agmatinyltransferase TiaS
LDLDVFVPQIVGVCKVIDRAAAKTIEVVIAALQRAIPGQQAEVPLAHEGGPVSGLAQERGQRGMARRQTGVAAGERLVETISRRS